MLSKNQEKFIRSLGLKKNRKLESAFIIEGNKLIQEAIDSNQKIMNCFVSGKWLEKNEIETEYQEISEREMAKISSLKTPPGILAVLKMPEFKKELKDDMILVLEDIKDPGNLGTIIRTAESFGIKKIICSDETVDVYNSKVVQASMGSIFRIKVSYQNLESYLEDNSSSYTVYGTHLQGDNIYEQELAKPAIIIMGSESHGLSESLSNRSNALIKVPQAAGLESMNVSIATAVVLAEFRRVFGW